MGDSSAQVLDEGVSLMAYFPNGSSGEVLDSQCADCPLDAGWNNPNQKRLFDDESAMKPCPIALVQLTHNYTQVGNANLENAMEILIDKDGICRTRELLLTMRKNDSA